MTKITAEQAERTAAFLKKWSKKKPIRRQADSNFFAAGKWMTKVPPEQIEAMEAAGLAELKGNVLTLR